MGRQSAKLRFAQFANRPSVAWNDAKTRLSGKEVVIEQLATERRRTQYAHSWPWSILRRGCCVPKWICGALAVLCCVQVVAPDAAQAQTGIRIGNLCRVKGQEQNRLQGLGLVIGLNGTGDGGDFRPGIDLLAAALARMGNRVERDALAEANNVALVMVEATIPATGARQGDGIDCAVSSVGAAKSLRGGRLFSTPLLGPDPQDTRVYALASGPLVVEDIERPTTARVLDGAHLEADFFHLFSLDDHVNLVIDTNRASFNTASEIAYWVNYELKLQNEGEDVARALDSKNVQVLIPEQYRDTPVDFIAAILNIQIQAATPFAEARVVVNEKTGTIVISGEVEISPVVVVVDNVTVSAGNQSGIYAVDPGEQATTNLHQLVQALEAVQVSAETRIRVIRELEKSGKLHAWVIYE